MRGRLSAKAAERAQTGRLRCGASRCRREVPFFAAHSRRCRLRSDLRAQARPNRTVQAITPYRRSAPSVPVRHGPPSQAGWPCASDHIPPPGPHSATPEQHPPRAARRPGRRPDERRAANVRLHGFLASRLVELFCQIRHRRNSRQMSGLASPGQFNHGARYDPSSHSAGIGRGRPLPVFPAAARPMPTNDPAAGPIRLVVGQAAAANDRGGVAHPRRGVGAQFRARASWSRTTAPTSGCARPRMSATRPRRLYPAVGTSSQLGHSIALFEPLRWISKPPGEVSP